MPAYSIFTPQVVPGGGGSFQPVFPAGYAPQDGDYGVIWTGIYEGSARTTQPTGWNIPKGQSNTLTQCWYRRMAAGDTLPLIVWTNGFKGFAVFIALRGDSFLDVVTAIENAVLRSTSSTGSIGFSGMPIGTDNCFLLAMGYRRKTSAGDGETDTAPHLAPNAYTRTIPASVPTGTHVVCSIAHWQQTTAISPVLDVTAFNKSDVNDACVGYVLAIKTQPPASASFTAGPQVNSVTRVPTAAYTLGFTPSASGTFYAVAVKPGATVPTATQIKAGHDSTGGAALAAVSKAVTGADTAVLGGSLIRPRHDLHCTLDTGTLSAVASILGAYTQPRTGKQFIVISGVPDASTDSVLASASPAVASPDTLESDLVNSAGGTMTFSATGEPAYSGTSARVSFTSRYFDDSGDSWSADVTSYNRDIAPIFGTFLPQQPVYAFPLNSAITPVDLKPLFSDVQGDPIIVTATSDLPTGMTVSTSAFGGTPTVSGILDVTLQGTNKALDFDTGVVTVITGDVDVPQTVGQQQDDAVTLLGAAYVNALVQLVASETGALGEVVNQIPAAGSSVAPFSNVQIFVVNQVITPPPPPVTVQNLTGAAQGAHRVHLSWDPLP